MKAFRIAVGRLGSQTAMADLLGLTQQAISKRLKNNMPLQRQIEVLAVEAATGVPRHELRPDLYPIEDRAFPAQPTAVLSPLAQRPAAHPSASASCPPEGQDADGSSPALDYPGVDPLEGLAA